jgi:aspartate oxidase
VKEFQSRIEYIALTLESKTFLIVCWVIIRNALMQHESKGAHFSSDFLNADYTDAVGLVIDTL